MTGYNVQLLFLDLALILLLARGLGALAVRVGQPPVLGEILAGILLGPTLFDGAVAALLFPDEIRPLLSGLADVGVALFMFIIGLGIEHTKLRGHGRGALGAAVGSTVIPFVLGIGLAFFLLRRTEPDHVAGFVIFIGLAVSVTAFPVLARIIGDRGLAKTELGAVALAVAGAVDVVAWTALAVVQAVAGDGPVGWTLALAVPYVAVLMLLVRPWLRRFLTVERPGAPLGAVKLVVVVIGVLLSAAATEAMGMHFIFGAFLFGVVLPRTVAPAIRHEIDDRVTHMTAMLLPVYFVIAGLKVDLAGLRLGEVADLGVILLVAALGKLGGTYLGARSQGLPPRPSAALASLMNTRGLTELVIVGVGLQLGLLDQSLYSLLVVMAVATTAMTGPLLTWIYRRPVELTPDITGGPVGRTLARAQPPSR